MADPIQQAADKEPDRLIDHLRRFIDGIEERPILPSQFFESTGRLNGGETKIRYRILRDGIKEFRKHAFSTTPRGMATFRETQAWILSNDSDWPYSFSNLCEVLGIDPEAARASLIRWRNKEEVKRNGLETRPTQEASGEESGGGGSALPNWCGCHEAQERAEERCSQSEEGLPG
jgi:hypothetical protein